MLLKILPALGIAFCLVMACCCLIEGAIYAQRWLNTKINNKIDNKSLFNPYLSNMLGTWVFLTFAILGFLILRT